ncbi:DNA topoisomerase 2 [Apophysomyces ossiformis]|uniref:DNA topoisomerase 2 n=1 Tax=Apophysomyces ossiformis TaxID=679940 RepID=A0A8H7BX55_9FUNG|nr:DNA topoisomerase 2 [Apophysomyces ossiformis]
MTISDDDFESVYSDSGAESDAYVPDDEPAPKKASIPLINADQDDITSLIKKEKVTKNVPKSKASSPPEDVDMVDAAESSGTSTPKSSSSKAENEERTIEEIYQKKSQLEHVLLRPDTYIGSVEAEEQEMWVYDAEEDQIKKKKIRYVPGLYKIVDEILVNAADNKIRDPSMNAIKVVINRSENFISIQNNGRGIPIEMHKEENVYVPELIFGHLLTSSNYNDNEKKVTGGRNGYGAKLCNIFSTEFIVETADKERKLKYHQVFNKNMTIKHDPKITKNAKGEEYTRISFNPDLSKFGMTEMDEDFEALIKKRVYDLAGCVEGVNVYLNGTKIPVKGFKNYVELYTKSMDIRNAEGKKPIIFEPVVSPRWQVAFAVSDGQFNQVSFVNSICTAKGGSHVNYVADQIVKALVAEVQKKSGNKNIKPFQIKNHMCIFLNCLIENPSFDSQTKENMTLRVGSFGSTYKLSEKFISLISKSGIIDNIVKWVKFREDEQMAKADSGKMSRRLNIAKLEDANWAGLKNKNKECTLILTEGDSAKALVLSGLSVVGRDKFGVFPLRGKLLNVRDASNTQIMSNAEISNIKSILGLKHGKTYTSVDELRYGKLMIMTDQDHDGSHIKGLLINFIDQMFPSLLDIPGFLLEFITPIIKGLGTSDKSDARKYFSQLEVHRKEFEVPNREERQLIDMAFSKKKVADRKQWLAQYEPGIYIDHSVNKIKISDFVNRELMLFSMADNIRSIPSVVDGFKPGQRKVFYGSIKRGKNSEIKVSQLANYVAGVTQYHHGEASVAATVINMAQDFVGSNNINLLVPAGQFGTRHEGGKAAASPRYLFTRLAKVARYIFHPDDDDILTYLIEENKSIEPNWYIPILPMVLVNGADGIGTGWSTSIPNYNPRDLVDNIIRLMNGEELVPMKPWFRGFKGDIIPNGSGKYTVNGIASITEEGSIKVNELPVRVWTESFKEHLDNMRDPTNKKTDINILDYSNNSTDMAVEFTVELDDANLEKSQEIGLLKVLKLTSSISTNNLVCFDKEGKIKKYNSAEEILKEFYDLRLEYYQKRKEYLIYVLNDEYERLDNKSRFIELVINDQLVYINRKEEDVIADMEKHGLKRMYPRKKKNVLATEDDEGDNEAADSSNNGYEYLFTINVRGFTVKKVEELRKQRENKLKELEEVKATSAQAFWKRDLDVLMEQWDAILQEDEILNQQAKPLATAKTRKRKRVTKPKAVKKEEDA